MPALENLEFVSGVPVVGTSGGLSPLESARKKLLKEIDFQIALAKDPNFKIVKTVNKRDGSPHTLERKPRSWVTFGEDFAYVTVRISDKPVSIGGNRGAVVRCSHDEVVETLEAIRSWADSSEADELILDTASKSKRGKRTNN